MKIYIGAAAAIGPAGDTTHLEREALSSDPQPADLEALVSSLNCQDELRRVSRYTKMALMGAQTALGRLPGPVDEKTALYFGTGLGELENTISLFSESMDPHVLYTSPYSFVSSVNNSTAFYVAKINGLMSKNMTVCQEEFSFEWTLKVASFDLLSRHLRNALVGAADESSFPRSEHMHRLKLEADQIMGEGSGWLCLQTSREGAVGELFLLEELPAVPERGIEWLDIISGMLEPYFEEVEDFFLLPGFRLHKEEVDEIIKRFPTMECKNYLDYCGCFHSAAAFGIASAFDDRHEAETLYFHLNRNLFGRLFIVGVKVYSDGMRGGR
ncbi:MAG: hypothetical protein IME96_08110 [Proteobacteria bacterium]|nr:hypothetical protein [Pseudomonadota bacterium]